MNGQTETKRAGRDAIVLFAVLVLASACGNLSQTAVNAMLGTISEDFGVPLGTVQWLSTGYMLMLGIAVLTCTFLTKRLSVRALSCGAIALFGVGSALDACATGFVPLVIGRLMQAVSAGITLPLMQTTAMTRFPRGRQATAMGIAGIAMGFAPNIGPTVGGALVEAAGWRSFFVLLAGISAVLFVAGWALIERTPAIDRAAKLDGISLVLSTLGFGGLLLSFGNISGSSLASAEVIGPFAVGAVCVLAFFARQPRVANPLVNLHVMRSARFRAGLLAQCLLFASHLGIVLVIPLFVEGYRGESALVAGMVLLPGTVAALVVNPIAGVLCDRVGVRPVALAGSCLLAVGTAGMLLADEQTSIAVLMAVQGVRAMGVSALIGPLASWSLAGLDRRLVSDGSSFTIVVRQACSSLATAVMVLPFTTGPLVATLAGYRVAFALATALAIGVLATVVPACRE